MAEDPPRYGEEGVSYHEEGVSYHEFKPSFVVAIHPDGQKVLHVDWSGSYNRSWVIRDGSRQPANSYEATSLVNDGAWGNQPILPQGTYPLIDLPMVQALMRNLEELLEGREGEGS